MKQFLTPTICLLVVLFAPELSSAQKPELVVQTGHSSNVNSVAFSPDGKTLVSGGDDNAIKLWDVATGRELRTLKGHSGQVTSVAFSHDGKTLASGSWDYTARLWDVSSGAELHILEHSSWVTSIAFSPDGKTLASGSVDEENIKLWDVASGRLARDLAQHSSAVSSLAFSADGNVLASGSSKDHTIKLWEVGTGRELRTLSGHSDQVTSVAFDADGKTLASGGKDHTIRVWEVGTGRELRTLSGHSDEVTSVAFDADGTTLASGSRDQTIKLWNEVTGQLLLSLAGHDWHVNSVAFSPDGKKLASGSGDKTIKLWEVGTGQELRTFKSHSSGVGSVAFSPDGKRMASVNSGGVIELWDTAAGQQVRTLAGSSVAFSPDGNTIAGGDGNRIKVWDVASGQEIRTFDLECDWKADVNCLSIGTHRNTIRSVAFSPDNKTVAGSGADSAIQLWDVTTGKLLRFLYGYGGGDTSVVFSPDGQTLASVTSNSNKIRLWDVRTGRSPRTLTARGGVSSVAFSPDDRILVSGSLAGSYDPIILWGLSTGAELRTLKEPHSAAMSLAFSPDGKTLATGGDDNTISLWEVATGTLLHTLTGVQGTLVSKTDSREYSGGRFIVGTPKAVTSLAFSSDGRTLASAGSDVKIQLWRTDSGEELAYLISLDKNDWLVMTPDGLFDGTPSAWQQLIWRFNNNTFDHAPVEAFFNEFYYPGLLSDIMSGKRPKAPSDISQKDRRQPQLKLMLRDAQANATLTTRNVTVKIDVAELAADRDHKAGSGAQDVRLFRNGSLVKVWRGDVLKGKSSVELEATVPIVAGEIRLTAYAFNHDNIKSSDATLVVNGADSLKRSGTAYILAVGVNKYSNPQYNLKYAVADAQDFSAEVKRQQELLKRYAQVEITSLSDAEATKANITQALTQLAPKVQPEDAVIIYFAGHGTAYGKQFYLIPHDLGYRGRRDKLNEAGLQTILSHSISDREMEKLFEGIDAGQILLVIDACNSGQALEAEEKRRGPMNSKGLAQLAYEKGMYVLTAAQSYQAAQEAAKLGHGFLTYALVEDGLKQGKADREPKDRAINLREWLNYATEQVPRMQEENMLDALRGRSRYLNFVGDGTGPKDAKSNVQRPRIFYRRELDNNPLIIAVLGAPAPQ